MDKNSTYMVERISIQITIYCLQNSIKIARNLCSDLCKSDLFGPIFFQIHAMHIFFVYYSLSFFIEPQFCLHIFPSHR